MRESMYERIILLVRLGEVDDVLNTFAHPEIRQDVITIAWIDNHSHLVYRFGWNIKCYMSLSNPPYPTAQTTYSRDIKFGMESQ